MLSTNLKISSRGPIHWFGEMLLETRNHLAKVVVDAVVALFEAYGGCAEPAGLLADPVPMQRSVDTAGVIGFAGPKLRGTLILGTNHAPLQRIIDSTTCASADDWIVELTNQLMGRIKNALASFDLEVEMSTPVALSKFAVGRICDDEAPQHFSFTANGGRCEVWLNATANGEIEWRRSEVAAHEEGSVHLF